MKVRLQIQPVIPGPGRCICCKEECQTTHRDDDLSGFVGDCCAWPLKLAEINLRNKGMAIPTVAISDK
jgi:hypothetical protein